MKEKINISLTNNKKQKPDEQNLPFGKYFSDHMFVMDYAEGEGWKDARIVPHVPFLIEPAAMVFHYGQSVFEGLKAYRADDGRALLFRPDLNFARLNSSNERMCIPRIDEEFALEALKELLRIERDWIPKSEGTSLYIRPFIIADEPMLGVRPSRTYTFMIIAGPVGAYYKTGIAPVRILVENEYVRAFRGGVGFTKASANYAVSLKGQEGANAKQCAQVLWLDGLERKYAEEVGSMNVFFVIDGVAVTPDLTGSILPGVTRDSVKQLLNSWGVPVVERNISTDEIFGANERLSEAFGTGTAAVISPIGELVMGDKTAVIGGGQTGELSKRLYDTLTGIQYGRIKDEFNWTVSV